MDNRTSTKMAGYIYAIQVREFMKTKESIIKVGRTEDIIQRFNDYPKGSRLLYTCYVEDCRQAEHSLLSSMRELFINRKDIGREYYEGQINNMIEHVKRIVVLPTNYFELMNTKNDTEVPDLIKDTDLIVRKFMDENMSNYDGNLTRSSKIYDDFMVWIDQNREVISKRSISHKRFSSALKEFYGAEFKPHRFADGVAASVMIHGPNSAKLLDDVPNDMKTFTEEYFCKDSGGYFTLKEAKEMFSNSRYYKGKGLQGLRKELEVRLDKPCIEQKKIGGKVFKNLFMGYRLRGSQENQSDELQINPVLKCYVLKYLESIVMEKSAHGSHSEQASRLHSLFNEWLTRNGFKVQYNATSFGLKITEYADKSQGAIEKVVKSQGIFYVFDITQLRTYLSAKGLMLDEH